jgi:hypothetical protein
VAGDAMVGTGDVGERRWVLAVGRELELTAAARGGGSVTTPPEIIPYYHLNHSIWSLSDNKEVSR